MSSPTFWDTVKVGDRARICDKEPDATENGPVWVDDRRQFMDLAVYLRGVDKNSTNTGSNKLRYYPLRLSVFKDDKERDECHDKETLLLEVALAGYWWPVWWLEPFEDRPRKTRVEASFYADIDTERVIEEELKKRADLAFMRLIE